VGGQPAQVTSVSVIVRRASSTRVTGGRLID
jgi:hypothetical protein